MWELCLLELTQEQKELTEKLKILDENIEIKWRGIGVVSMIKGLIKIPITKDIDESVRHFLIEYSALFGIKSDLSDLKFINKAEGIETIHIRYQQIYEEIPVSNFQIAIHIKTKSKIILIKSSYRPHSFIGLDTKAILNVGLSKEKAIEIAYKYLDSETRLKGESVADIVILPTEDQFHLAWEVSVSLKDPIEKYHIYVDVGNGNIIKKMDMLKRQLEKEEFYSQSCSSP
jgi:Zn-dependent metalloprotease